MSDGNGAGNKPKEQPLIVVCHLPVDGVSRNELAGKVQQAEEMIRRRVPIGTRTSEKILKDYLISQVSERIEISRVKAIPLTFLLASTIQNFTDATVQRALDILIRRGTLQFERRRMVLTRVSY